MTASRLVIAFAFSLALVSSSLAAGGVFIGNGLLAPLGDRVGNGSPMLLGTGTGNPSPQAELTAKCIFHWTSACDEAFGPRNTSPLASGEGVPLPWPMPFGKGGDGSGI